MATNTIRWSDKDQRFGPFIYAREKYSKFAVVLGSGDGDEYPGCSLRMQAFGHTLILAMPAIIRPWRKKIAAPSWDAATVARMGRNWYWDSHAREYGFSYSNDGGGFLQVFLGPQTHDSSTTKSWSCLTPWDNRRHVRHSFYGLRGEHFWDEPENERSVLAGAGIAKTGMSWEDKQKFIDSCPTRTFQFADFDGEQISAKTRIEEREWRHGTGWFKWLSWFRKPLIRRSLDIHFSGETGKRKGSWKGGTIGHAIEMLPGELHEAAFKRYCTEHNMTFAS